MTFLVCFKDSVLGLENDPMHDSRCYAAVFIIFLSRWGFFYLRIVIKFQ